MDANAPLQVGAFPPPQSLHRNDAFPPPCFDFDTQTFTQALHYALPASPSILPHFQPSPPHVVPMPTPMLTPMDAQWAALKARRWSRGKDLTAFVQDLALQSGKRACVATSGGSYKKFVCSSASACPWLLNAVYSRPRKRPREPQSRERDSCKDEARSGERYWSITSGHIFHANCASAAKPTARQLQNSALLQAAVQRDARVSSAVLVERLRTHAQLECSKSLAYKAKTELLDALAATSAACAAGASVQHLPSYFAQLSAQNTHVLGRVERDDASGCFVRAILAMDPTRVWDDQYVLGLDSRHSRSCCGTPSTQLALVGRDGNLTFVVHAVALVPDASLAHIAWFLAQLLAHGFPLRRFPLVTNGSTTIVAACAAQHVPYAMCDTPHVVAAVGVVRGSQEEALVWRAQQAETEHDFAALLHQLAQLNAAAAQRLGSVDPAQWAIFPHLSRRKLYGWQATLLADQHDTLATTLASQSPYAFFQAATQLLVKSASERHECADQWERERRVVTPAAERLMRDELQLASAYSVAMHTPQLAFVWRTSHEPQLSRQRRVDLQHRTCTCAFRLQYGVPCRHLLAVLLQATAYGGGLARVHEFFDECYLVRTYAASFHGRQLKLPLDESVERDPTLRPPCFVRSADAGKSGGSDVQSLDSQEPLAQELPAPLKKRRVRTRPLEQRKRGLYKCHRCHRADGHNKGTCPYPPHQAQELPVEAAAGE